MGYRRRDPEAYPGLPESFLSETPADDTTSKQIQVQNMATLALKGFLQQDRFTFLCIRSNFSNGRVLQDLGAILSMKS